MLEGGELNLAEIGRAYGFSYPALNHQVLKLHIDPARRVGNHRYFSPAQVQQIIHALASPTLANLSAAPEVNL